MSWRSRERSTLRLGDSRDEELVDLGRDGLRAVPFFSLNIKKHVMIV